MVRALKVCNRRLSSPVFGRSICQTEGVGRPPALAKSLRGNQQSESGPGVLVSKIPGKRGSREKREEDRKNPGNSTGHRVFGEFPIVTTSGLRRALPSSQNHRAERRNHRQAPSSFPCVRACRKQPRVARVPDAPPEFRDDSDDFSTSFQSGIGHLSHQSDVAPSVNEFEAPLCDQLPQLSGSLGEPRIVAGAGTTVDRDGIQRPQPSGLR